MSAEPLTTIAGRDPQSREGRILATARDLLHPELWAVWEHGYIDAELVPYPPSTGEQVILDALSEAWRGVGTFGALASLSPADRSALVALLEPTGGQA